MPIKVVIRVSRRMTREDVIALRTWLERTYPARWDLVAGEEKPETLGIAEDVLTAVLTSAAGVTTEMVLRAALEEQIQRLVKRYRKGEQPTVELEITDEPDDAGDDVA